MCPQGSKSPRDGIRGGPRLQGPPPSLGAQESGGPWELGGQGGPSTKGWGPQVGVSALRISAVLSWMGQVLDLLLIHPQVTRTDAWAWAQCGSVFAKVNRRQRELSVYFPLLGIQPLHQISLSSSPSSKDTCPPPRVAGETDEPGFAERPHCEASFCWSGQAPNGDKVLFARTTELTLLACPQQCVDVQVLWGTLLDNQLVLCIFWKLQRVSFSDNYIISLFLTRKRQKGCEDTESKAGVSPSHAEFSSAWRFRVKQSFMNSEGFKCLWLYVVTMSLHNAFCSSVKILFPE